MDGLAAVFEDIARGRLRPADQAVWVSEFFKREDLYRVAWGAGQLDSPQGTQRKKDPDRRGAHDEAVAIAYARWLKPGLSAGLTPLTIRSDIPLEKKAFSEYMALHYPHEPYERLSVLTPRALYSMHLGLVLRFDFERDKRAAELPEDLSSWLLESIDQDVVKPSLVPAVFRRVYAEDDERTHTDPFMLYAMRVRAVRPSR
ncbi:MAG: hypothetical protein ACMXYM_01845 [Candidatus Woesearchaeota archaeon]